MRMEISNRTPEQIASEINFIKEESGKMMLSNAVEIGGCLTEAKELVPHGEWLKWLTESVSYSRSTASRLMKIFREYGPILSSPVGEGGANGAPVHHLNYTQGLILFGIPLEDRDQFIADNDVGNMSQRELRQTIIIERVRRCNPHLAKEKYVEAFQLIVENVPCCLVTDVSGFSIVILMTFPNFIVWEGFCFV
ncbi:DUF3102 domain-containing protein [Desulfosporosinus nitroreducens]|uniref:DUF3102 domain-containing protein n=1 Tax=Desulfosporosinus nitroreducens TaxID=2018668 RepID=A0ABT8QR48_9FIRM|nr:DUF3102 domain-containing protein [Desulfosporosinus nitroreducens]MDO0823125.1 DUF3102 domain-containing protein [Desulfosporosinus nitroreducens]